MRILLIFILVFTIAYSQTVIVNTEEYNDCSASTLDSDKTTTKWSSVQQANNNVYYGATDCYKACEEVATTYKVLQFTNAYKMIRQYTVNAHYQLQVTLKAVMINDWAAGEKINILIDGTIATSASKGTGSIGVAREICNIATNSDDEDHALDTGNYVHTATTLTIEVEGLPASGNARFSVTDFYFQIDECHSECESCNGPANTDCTACPDNFYLTGGSCVACATGCLKCNGTATTNCLRCGTGVLQMDSNECQVTQPQGYYLDTTCTDPVDSSTVSCYMACAGTDCATCNTSDPTECLTCPSTYYLNTLNDQCATTCPDGYFKNTGNGQCGACTNNCKTCNANSSDCTDCPTNYALYSSTCVDDTNCPDGFFFELVTGPPDRICSSCPSNCLKCTSATVTDCQRCNSGTSHVIKFNVSSSTHGQCYSSCPAGTYSSSTCTDPLDSSTITCCMYCNTGCASQSCTGPLTTDCATCDTGNNWVMVTGHGCQKECSPAQSTCQSCESDQTTCNYCVSGKFLNNGACISSPCPDGTFDDSTNWECASCDAECETCSGSSSNCLSCNAGYALNGSTCINDTDCPTNTFFNSSNLECTACAANCQVCLDATASECKRCDSGTSKIEMDVSLTKGTCQTSCQAGTYDATCVDTIDGVTSIGCCLPCESSCLTCTNSSQCVTCPTNEYLQPGTSLCAATCPDQYFKNNSGYTCDSCTNNCYTCNTSSSDCTNCITNYALSGSTCVADTACPDGTFFELITGSPDQRLCSACETTTGLCQKCTSNALTDCQRCDSGSSGKMVFNAASTTIGQCVTTCPSGTYQTTCLDPLDASTITCCEPCHAACATLSCTGSSETDCTACEATWVLVTGQGCHKACSPTQATCKSCEADQTTCRYCETSNFLANGACSGSCPAKYFEDSVNRLCVSCNSECATCTGSASFCNTCESGYSLYNNSCISDSACPSRTFFNSSNLQCEDCTANCLVCTDGTSTNCQRCDGSTVIQMNLAHTLGECVASCPTGTYQTSCSDPIDSSSIICCLPCATGCLDCTSGSLTSCTSCDTGNGYQYESGPGCVRTCNPVQATCDTCLSDRTTCRTCTSGNYLDSVAGTCGATCPSLYFQNNGYCTACFVGCTACTTTSTNCSACANGYYLNGSTCSSTCPDGFYLDTVGNTCASCTANCLQCTSNAATDCMRCDAVNGFYLQFNVGQFVIGTCSNVKPTDAFIALPSDSLCQDPIDSTDIYCYITCNPACTTCTGPLITDCNTCDTNYIYQAGQGCVYTCTNAALNCLTCYLDDVTCINCTTGNYLYNGTCGPSCPTNSQTFENTANGVCEACNSRCFTCTFSADNCQSCNSGYLFHNTNQFCYSTCPIGSFPNDTTNTCDLCDSTCESCTGPSASECTSCYDALPILFQNTCVQCSDFTGLEDDPNSVGDCFDICGDGITVKFYGDNDLLEVTNFLTCDDANTIDNDGCDPQCQVMEGWECTGGSTTTEDVCKDITPSEISFEFLNFGQTFSNDDNSNEPLVVIIRFSKKIYVNHPTNTLQDYFQINVIGVGDDMGKIISFKEIDGEDSDFEQDQNRRYVRRNLAYPPVVEGPQYYEMKFIIEGNIVERSIEIMVVNGGDLVDYNGNSISYGGSENPNSEKVPMYLYSSDKERDNAFKGGYLVSVFVGVVQVGALLLLFSGRYFHAIGSVDSLQMVDMLQFLKIDWPLNGLDYFERITSNRLQWLFNNFLADTFDEYYREPGSGFKKQNIDASFIKNMGQYLIVTAVLILIYLIIKVLTIRVFGKCCCKGFARNLARYKQSVMEWGYLLDILNYMTLYFVAFGFLNYVSISFKQLGGIIGLILSHFCWFLPIIMFVLGTRYILKNSIRLYPDFEIQNEQFWFQVYSSKVCNLNYTYRWRNLWYLLRFNQDQSKINFKQYMLLIFLLRKILYGLIMVIMVSQPFVQLFLFCCFNVLIVAYIAILRPFQRLRDNFKYILCECLMFISQIALMLLEQQDNRELEQERKDYTWIMIFCSSAAVCIHILFMVNEGIWAVMLIIYNKYKNRYKSKKQSMQIHNYSVKEYELKNQELQQQHSDEDLHEYNSDQESDVSAIMPIKSDFRKQIFQERDIIQFNNSEFAKHQEFKHIGQKPIEKQVLNADQIEKQKKAYDKNKGKRGYNIEDEDERNRKYTPKQESRNRVHKVVINNTKIKY